MPVIRIVQMTFSPDKVSVFLDLFAQRKHMIREFEGCLHLELWRHQQQSNIFYTYSIWESEEALNRYRASHFFDETWQQTKVLFADKPVATTLYKWMEAN